MKQLYIFGALLSFLMAASVYHGYCVSEELSQLRTQIKLIKLVSKLQNTSERLTAEEISRNFEELREFSSGLRKSQILVIGLLKKLTSEPVSVPSLPRIKPLEVEELALK